VKERVQEDFLGLLTNTVNAPCTLDQSDDGPREVIVNDDVAILEVLAFGENVGGYQHADFIGLSNRLGFFVGLGV